MHFWVALFHEQDSDPESLMYPYSYEDEEYQEFQEDYSKEDAEKMFQDFKRTKAGKKSKDDLETYMQVEHSCYTRDDDGNFGNNNNPNGIYDWFCVGGRVANSLYLKMSKAEMKKLQKEEMSDKMKFKSHLAEYLRLYNLSPKEYILERERTLSDDNKKDKHFMYDIDKGVLGHTSISVANLDIKTTLDMWHDKTKNMSDIFENVICEDEGLLDSENFNRLLRYWKKRGGVLTVIDCHT